MTNLECATDSDMAEISDFLRIADLTLSGLDSPTVHLWISRNETTGRIFASIGYDSSEDGRPALIRSVAVDPELRGVGIGLELAQFAMDRAVEAGAHQAWLFSRRSGPFWQKTGFRSADTKDLAIALASTHEVQLFTETGQVGREVPGADSSDNPSPACSV